MKTGICGLCLADIFSPKDRQTSSSCTWTFQVHILCALDQVWYNFRKHFLITNILLETSDHGLIKITDKTLDIIFSRFGWNSFTRQRWITRQREHVLCRLRETPLGFCLRVSVNEFHPNLEKTISSVLSVIFILIN